MNPNNPQTKERLRKGKPLGGRPLKYPTPEELQTAIDKYFEETEFNDQTMTGLALSLGFNCRKDFWEYSQKDKFAPVYARARARIEHKYEKSLLTCRSPYGAAFALKQMGWEEKKNLSVDANINVVMNKH